MNTITAVMCAGCLQPMQRVRVIAVVRWSETSATREVLYECTTVDCGNSTQVEEDC